jgi:uncharacterized glyoxalase superfamily protein PhnB
MKLNAIGIVSTNMQRTIAFYSLLGFKFGQVKPGEDHIEPITSPGDTRLMIDSKKLISEILGEDPKPANHSAFALEYDSSEELNSVAQKVKDAGYKIVKEPWDAFWGQRYAIVEDPDGYKVDLYSNH